jgi:D-3-phosphoglycerate dehydrogenase / 2-oxoglutarate reductase
MKVLISDGIAPEGAKILKDVGIEITEQFFAHNELLANIKDFDAIIVRSATEVRKDIIDAGNLKVIARSGVGLDNIDVDYAKSKGIKILNTPSASSVSVAELAIAHIFSLSRFLNQSNITMRIGEWNKKQYSKGSELTGKTLGIFGLGAIGKEVARRGKGLMMNVVAYNKFHQVNDLGTKMLTRDSLLKKADIISVHIPLSEDKSPEIGAKEIEMMKDGVMIINCARGGVVDETALLDALKSGKVSAAAMDVFQNEPCTDAQSELLALSNVSLSPHIGASTKEAQLRVSLEIAEKVAKELNKQ